jgi:hypothetical protein
MPDQHDVEAALRALGHLSIEELSALILDLDLEGQAAAAVAEWEALTGFKPFLADLVDVTRYYDPPGPNTRLPGGRGGGYLLDLGTGLVSVTSIHTAFSATDAGDAAVSETNYRLRGLNASVLTSPYTHIESLSGHWYGLGRSIRIIGRWGYGTSVPEDAWQAIRMRAAGMVLSEIREQVTGGMVEWKEADASERYGEKFLSGTLDAWDRRWMMAVNRYKRVTL